MILTKQIRLDLPTTTFFVQINDYGKWEASFQISIKPQEIVLTFASRNGKFKEGVNKFCSSRSCLANVYHVVGSFWVSWVNSIKPFQQKAWFSIFYWFSIYILTFDIYPPAVNVLPCYIRDGPLENLWGGGGCGRSTKKKIRAREK